MYKSTRQFGVGSEVRRIGPLDGKDVFQAELSDFFKECLVFLKEGSVFLKECFQVKT